MSDLILPNAANQTTLVSGKGYPCTFYNMADNGINPPPMVDRITNIRPIDLRYLEMYDVKLSARLLPSGQTVFYFDDGVTMETITGTEPDYVIVVGEHEESCEDIIRTGVEFMIERRGYLVESHPRI